MYDQTGALMGLLDLIFSLQFVLFVIVLLLAATMIVITPGKRAKIVERLGRPLANARMPGLSLKLPWPIDHVVGVIIFSCRK
ncbi:MAG: hypothetical protein AB7O39_02830 [Flavobacteriaceae bacterium]